MKEICVKYTSYNLWANKRLVEAFEEVVAEKLEATIVSSFPSVRQTFLHIWDAETLWLKRLNGISPTSFPSKSFVGDNAAVFAGLLQASQDFKDFVAEQASDFFEKKLEFTTLSYGPQAQQAHEMIHHCMNHSTFHRGQLITMGRQLGVEKFPLTDFAYYLREGGK